LEAGVPVVTFSWGDPEPYLAPVRAAGAAVGIQVTNVAGAQRALQFAPDFLICQGIEAGGHVQSTRSLWEVLPLIVEAAAGTPVVAAGGIADGTGITRSLRLGAAAAMLGTRFVATQESRAHPEYKRLLVEETETALTVCFEGGWPQAAHRVLRNGTLERWEAAGSPPPGQRPGEGEVVAQTATGEAILRYEDTTPRVGFTGEISELCLYAGTGVAAIRDIPTAAQVIAQLEGEM
jgi:NAD(P)H-dependent flavin oxidoreductase YrpB (nitropropane dioxygenase family)